VISVDEARAIVREHAAPLNETEDVALAAAAGRVLAGPVRNDRDDPPFDRAMMDGFAVRAADTVPAPARLRVVGRIAAGAAELPEVPAGGAAWINTGAPLPPGADAVVPVEQTREAGDAVEIEAAVEPGAAVMAHGTLARAGDVAAEGLLTPARIAVCASVGADPVRVVRRPRVAVLATGSELRGAPGAHQIRNSNGPMLRALLRDYEVLDLGVAGDDPAELERALREGLAADVLVTTGGVSKGEHDLVRPGLEALGREGLGLDVRFHGVALQPGKPVLFAAHASGVAFGLPGNPVSALVCAELFLLPYLAARHGRGFDDVLRATTGRLAGAVRASPRRRRVFPCRLHAGAVDALPWRSSADLYTVARGNAYMVVEPATDLEAGAEVECLVPERFGPA
jgi:molybdopterin molybdotransferase